MKKSQLITISFFVVALTVASLTGVIARYVFETSIKSSGSQYILNKTTQSPTEVIQMGSLTSTPEVESDGPIEELPPSSTPDSEDTLFIEAEEFPENNVLDSPLKWGLYILLEADFGNIVGFTNGSRTNEHSSARTWVDFEWSKALYIASVGDIAHLIVTIEGKDICFDLEESKIYQLDLRTGQEIESWKVLRPSNVEAIPNICD